MAARHGVHQIHWYFAKPKSALRVKAHFGVTYRHRLHPGSDWRKTLCNIVLSVESVRYEQWEWIPLPRGTTAVSRAATIAKILPHITCDVCRTRAEAGPPRVFYTKGA